MTPTLDDPRHVLTWFESLPKWRLFCTATSYHCPLAEYLNERGGSFAYVGSRYRATERCAFEITPQWALNFIPTVDSTGHSRITAGRCAQILSGIIGELGL